MVEELSSILRAQPMTVNGWMITNTAMDVKHGSKARSSLKASTAKERKMGAAATNGLMEASTKEISSTVSSKDKVSQLLATPLLWRIWNLFLPSWKRVDGFLVIVLVSVMTGFVGLLFGLLCRCVLLCRVRTHIRGLLFSQPVWGEGQADVSRWSPVRGWLPPRQERRSRNNAAPQWKQIHWLMGERLQTRHRNLVQCKGWH